MPAQEVSGVVNLHRLVDVHGNEVIKPGLSPGGLRRGRPGRLRLQALNGADVALPFRLA